jgi:hypothetical protein
MFSSILELKQSIRRRDNVLDFGARLRFEQGQGIDQNPLVGNELSGLFQLGQGRPCANTLLKHRARLQLGGWGQEVANRCKAGRGAKRSWFNIYVFATR